MPAGAPPAPGDFIIAPPPMDDAPRWWPGDETDEAAEAAAETGRGINEPNMRKEV